MCIKGLVQYSFLFRKSSSKYSSFRHSLRFMYVFLIAGSLYSSQILGTCPESKQFINSAETSLSKLSALCSDRMSRNLNGFASVSCPINTVPSLNTFTRVLFDSSFQSSGVSVKSILLFRILLILCALVLLSRSRNIIILELQLFSKSFQMSSRSVPLLKTKCRHSPNDKFSLNSNLSLVTPLGVLK